MKGYRYTDHLEIDNGHVLREMQSFESGLTARAEPVSRQSTGTKGKGLEKFSIRTPEPISESDSEVDAATASAAVDGYEPSGSSGPGSAFPPLYSCSCHTDSTDSRSTQLDAYSGPSSFPGDAECGTKGQPEVCDVGRSVEWIRPEQRRWY